MPSISDDTLYEPRWAPLAPVAGFAAALGVWYAVAATLAALNSELSAFVPTPLQVVVRGAGLITDREFWLSMAVTNFRVVSGFAIAVIVAVPLGVLLGSVDVFRRLVSPVSDFGRYLPVPALVPLLILWAGVGDLQKILLLAIGTFFQVLVLVTDAVRRVPMMHVDSALTLGTRPGQILTRVMLRAALPEIYDACRVGIGLTWSYLLVAEIVASERGLGYMIIRGQRFLQTDLIFFVIIVLGLLGFAYDRAFIFGRPRLFPWAIEERVTT